MPVSLIAKKKKVLHYTKYVSCVPGSWICTVPIDRRRKSLLFFYKLITIPRIVSMTKIYIPKAGKKQQFEKQCYIYLFVSSKWKYFWFLFAKDSQSLRMTWRILRPLSIFQHLLFSLSFPAPSPFCIYFFLHILSFSPPPLLVSKLVLFYFIQLLLPPLACFNFSISFSFSLFFILSPIVFPVQFLQFFPPPFPFYRSFLFSSPTSPFCKLFCFIHIYICSICPFLSVYTPYFFSSLFS